MFYPPQIEGHSSLVLAMSLLRFTQFLSLLVGCSLWSYSRGAVPQSSSLDREKNREKNIERKQNYDTDSGSELTVFDRQRRRLQFEGMFDTAMAKGESRIAVLLSNSME